MIVGECVFVGVIKSEHSKHALQTFERNGQRGAQSTELGVVVKVSWLDGRIAVDNGFAILRNPSGEALPDRDLQGREQAEIVAGNELRYQPVVLLAVDGDGVVRNQPLQAH